jgi:ABC-type transport system involved in multi-copper enzyme maturation permease subunit
MTSQTPLLGILVLERDPVGSADMLRLIISWFQDAGGFAFAGLVLWLLHAWRNPADANVTRRTPVTLWMQLAALFALICYMVGGGFILADWFGEQAKPVTMPDGSKWLPPSPNEEYEGMAFAIGGLFALIGMLQPFVVDLFKLSGRRVFALAKLSFKEAIRRRVLWVFLAFLIVFLFPPRWFLDIKKEDEIRTNVSVIYWAMTPLLLVTAGLLAAFGIPNDVKSQAIHTIVTKPVQRFEIVLGRFLGYTALMTLVLAALTAVSLLLIKAGGSSEEAAEESMKARDPVYGRLDFRARKAGFQGESVGREWGYRKYIAGGPSVSHRALYLFDSLPSGLGDGVEAVPCEFAFDIYRTTKGDENKGVSVSFQFVTYQVGPGSEDEARVRRLFEERGGPALANAQPGTEAWKKLDALAGELGYYEFRNKDVFDYHTYSVEIPAALIRKARDGTPGKDKVEVGGQEKERDRPRLRVIVKCESPTQFIGLARYDLYLLADEGTFGVNFFKGALGLWFRACLVIGLAVACSTYLSGIISFLVTVLILVAGVFREFIVQVALPGGRSELGGPFESLTRLLKNDSTTVPMDKTPTAQVAQTFDAFFRWVLRRFENIVPDVERFDFTNFVAEGFNVPTFDLLVNFLILVGYLLPWAVLAYYLIKTREIAS